MTTTDLNEYRSIPQQLRRLRDQRNYLKFVNEFNDLAVVEDKIVTLQKRRVQLRRQGAY